MPDEPSQSFFLKLKNLFSLSKNSEEVLKNTEPEDERIEELIENVLNIKDSIVKEIMIPKVNISFLTESDSLENVYSVVNDTKHSRYPVFNSDKDKVTGILHVKDMLGSVEDKFNLNTILREAKHVPESQSVTSLLEDFKKDKAHLAIVLDEYGVISGLITIEDILEEIVGEIEDEYDAIEQPLQTTGEGIFTLAGNLRLDEVEDICGLTFEEKPYETIAGFILDQLQRVPSVGEVFRYRYWKIEVLEMDKLRIATVRLTSPPFRSIRVEENISEGDHL